MSEHLYPALFALFVWWFSTGVIIYLDGLPRRTFRWSMLGATLILAGSMIGLSVTAGDTTVYGAYAAFTFGLLAWGWQEISFYMGYVTGPRNQPCPDGCGGLRHFGHAIQTSLYHELAIIAGALLVVAVTRGEPNQVGSWTFMVLWWMHQSAKLNVFLGARNLNEEFLPEHLQFLKSFLTKKPMNLLFPVSVTISTVICALLAQAAAAADATPFEVAGFTFLTTLMALAILEHWFLVLPLPAAKLWSWSLRSHRGSASKPFEAEIVAGFLGAGKTTYLKRCLAEVVPDERTVVLVNDFSAVGVDASLLSDQGADLIELPNGCICCSLRQDLARQLKEILARFAPERVLIEPSGVADVASLRRVLDQPEIRPLVKSLRVAAVVDAGAFVRDYARIPGYFEAQALLAQVIIVNKVDVASPAELQTVEDTLRALNPVVRIVRARYGVLEAETLAEIPAHAGPPPATATDDAGDHRHEEHAEVAGLGLRSWSAPLDGRCDPQGLRRLLEAVAGGDYGEVDRVKGLARAGAGWLRFDLAGGRVNVAAFAPRTRETARVVVIGRSFDETGLRSAFEACAAPLAA